MEVTMSKVEVRDYALWAKHVHGNEPLKAKLIALSEGEMIELEVDGFKGVWKKMDAGKDGRPTDGIKPILGARERWGELQDHRGTLVSIKEVTK